MLEAILCSLVSLLPDYLFRRYGQGKRIGHEITLFSMWYELRWGLTIWLMLTISLITVLFYYHPASLTVNSYFRTVTILPQVSGRVSEIHVSNNQMVSAGDPLIELDGLSQRASLDAARAQLVETEVSATIAETDLALAEAGVAQARAALTQSQEELERNETLRDQGSSAVRLTEIERLENLVDQRQAQLQAAELQQQSAQQQIDQVIPAKLESARAQVALAQAELDKTVIIAGIDGQIEQFGLQIGDFISPLARPAGILVPTESGRNRFQAAFSQIAAQVIHTGMVGEMGCMSKPLDIIPMVVTQVQDVIPAGQIRPTDQLADPQDNVRPGSVLTYLEPLYPGEASRVPPGSSCIVMLYTDNHAKLEDETLPFGRKIFLHVVDTIGVVHAAGLRLRMLFMPVQQLVFSGGH
jgi:multidrug resistance efflux pump